MVREILVSLQKMTNEALLNNNGEEDGGSPEYFLKVANG